MVPLPITLAWSHYIGAIGDLSAIAVILNCVHTSMDTSSFCRWPMYPHTSGTLSYIIGIIDVLLVAPERMRRISMVMSIVHKKKINRDP